MSYLPCAKASWTTLLTSFKPFSTRIVALFKYDIKNTWQNAYHFELEKYNNFDYRIKKIAYVIWQTLKNIVSTVKTLLIVLVSILSYSVIFFFAVFRCLIFPCPVSNKKPELSSGEDLFHHLKTEVNKEVTWIQNKTAPIFTPFKETGFINSWDNYDYWVILKGEILHATQSWDGLKTLDIRLIALAVFDNEQGFISANPTNGVGLDHTEFFIQNPKFIRTEIYPHVLLAYKGVDPEVSHQFVVKGRLKWDRDGFLEIHPKYGRDLQIVV